MVSYRLEFHCTASGLYLIQTITILLDFTLWRARPKSHILTCKRLFNNILCDFISLWTIPKLCKNCIPYSICLVIKVFFYSIIGTFLLWRKSYKVPYFISSITMHNVGGQVTAPINNTIFGCRYLDSIEISLLNSAISYSVMLGLNIFLMATSDPI